MPKQQNKSKWGFVIFLLILLGLTSYILAGMMSLFTEADYNVNGNVALIKVSGVITSERQGFGMIASSSPEIVSLIEKADKNPSIKAILFEINSPGGSAVGSKEIADAISRVNKTTLALIREVGASGGYWVASASDIIVASQLSITGSIGVIGSYLEFDKLFEKYGVNYRRLVSGKYKDIGSPLKEMNEEEQKIIQKHIDKVHDYFIREVAKNRRLGVEDVQQIADGLFFLGEDALGYGLVDFLGDMEKAKEILKNKLKITEVELVEYKVKKGFMESFFDTMSGQSYNLGKGIGEGLVGDDGILT